MNMYIYTKEVGTGRTDLVDDFVRYRKKNEI